MFLTADQFLLTTLVVKITIVAALATILVRYHRFRHILISERRAWPERLLFAFSLGVPLAAGVTSRLLLRYDAADLTLEGAFLAGLIAGPYAGALVALMVAVPALLAGEFIALFFAVGCGFAGGGLREACPNKEEIWHFSPFVFTKLHRHLWRMLRSVRVDWAVIFLLAPVELEEIRQFLGVDSLGYLSLDGMLAAAGKDTGFCHACFSGNYPTITPDDLVQLRHAMPALATPA